MTERQTTPPELDRARVPPPGPLRPFHFPPTEHARLSNGLPVLAAHVPRLPLVSVSLLLDAGGVHEDRGRAGLATLTASLLESGAAGRSAVELAEALETLGVRTEAVTGWDASHVGFSALRSRAEPALELLALMAQQPDFPLDEVDRLRREQVADILQRRVEPRGLANEMIAHFVFAERTPFSRPLDGQSDTVESLTRSDVAAFHQAHYSAAGAQLLVAGDLEPARAVEWAERHFGGWTAQAASPPHVPVEPRSERPQVVVVHREGAAQSEVRVGAVGVARDNPDYFAIAVLNTLLGGAFSSRLNLNLRERHGFTYGVTSSFVMRRRPGPFLVSTAVQMDVTAAAVQEILRELRGVQQTAVGAAELDDARSFLAGTFPLRLQTTQGVVSRLAELALHDLPLDYYDHYRERVLAVTADDVLRAARGYLRTEQLTIVVVADAEQVRGPLEKLDIAPVEVVHPQVAS